MDIVESEYMRVRYPDAQEDELVAISKCYSCGEILYKYDEIINWEGLLSCNLLGCLLKMTGSEITILEESED